MTGEPKLIRLVLLAGTELDRRAVRRLLTDELAFAVVADLPLEIGAARQIAALRPDVALLVHETQADAELCLLGALRRMAPHVPVAVVFRELTREAAGAWRRLRVAGVVQRDEAVPQLDDAVRTVAAGRRRWPPPVVREATAAARSDAGLQQLSAREREVMQLLARGLTVAETASLLGLSYKTVDSVRTRIFRKLNVRNRVEMANAARGVLAQQNC